MMRIHLIWICAVFYSCQPSPGNTPPPVSNREVAISYTQSGKGDTAVLLIHGWCINKSYWEETIKALPDYYRVVAPDLGGHGQSGHNRKTWTIEDFADDVVAVINALDLKKVILVGHSMGGDVMLEAAGKLPGKVIGLVGIDNFKDVTDSIPAAQQASIDTFLLMIHSNYAATAGTFSRMSLFPPDYSDTVSVNRVIHDITTADSSMAIAAIESVIAYKEAGALQKLTLPLHLIVSDYTPVNEGGLKKFCQAGYFIKTIHGTGHYPMIEKPIEFNQLLEETLRSICRQR